MGLSTFVLPAGSAVVPEMLANPAVGNRTILGGDRIRISVDEDPQLSKVYPVAGDGTVDLGYVGRVPIAEMSVEEAAAYIQQLLEAQYFKQATVKIDVAHFVEGDVYVLGEVQKPRVIPFSGDRILTLVEAISLCDGFTRQAQGSKVSILRWKPGGSMERENLVVDVQTMFDTRDFRNDEYLRPRDMVIVPKLGEGEGAAEFLAMGQVASAGFHPWSEGMDLIRAISLIGGLARDAQLESATILRPDGSGGYNSIDIDLARLLGAADMSQNAAIYAGDIIYVPSGEHASRGRAYLLGEVVSPGAVDLPSDRDATVAKTILRAGGVTEYANTAKVRILRTGPDGTQQQLVVDVERILEKGEFYNDVPLRDEDVVIVPEKLFNL